MEVKIQKWGNSFGIRIPSNILKTLNIKSNDILDIENQDDKIIITKSNKQKISLAKRFQEYSGSYEVSDFSWDDSSVKGREIW